VPCRETEVSRSTFGGSVLSRASRASLPPARPFAGTPPPKRSRVVPGPAGSPLLGFLLPRTQLRRVPLLRHALPRGRTCGTRIARPSSVPSSGFLPLSTVPASTRLASRPFRPRRSPWPRRFAALFHAARVPGAPLQSFPFPGSRTRSRGSSASLRVRSPTSASAVPAGDSRPLSLVAPALCRSRPPGGGHGTHEPGREFPAVASPVASTRVSAPHVPSASHRHWARRLDAGTPASKLCSPRESVPRRPRALARLEAARRCSPGVQLPSRACSTTVPGSVSRVDMRRGQKPHATHASGRPAIAVAFPRSGLRCLGSRAQDPSIRAVCRTSRITVRQRPSSPSASRALMCAGRQPSSPPCRAFEC